MTDELIQAGAYVELPAQLATPVPPPAVQPDGVEPASYPAAASYRICVSALSDIGCVRTNNEDSFGYDDANGIYAVCDGMGGGPSGEVASATAVETILRSFASTAGADNPVSARLLRAIEDANAAVWQTAQTPENKGMGTTAVAVALDGSNLIVGNVGDSRAYLLKGGQCTQLTVDHSYLNELIRNGTLTIENAHQADLHGMESVICRAVGVAPEVTPDFFSVELEHGVAVLVTSDGLTRYLLQDEIVSVIAASSFDTACANLIDLAKQRGGVDNITCMLLLAVAADESR